MKIASVILDIPTQTLDFSYTYLVPDQTEGDYSIEVGCAVVVPFGARQVIGFVVELTDCEPEKLPAGLIFQQLKYIKCSVSEPYFDEEGAACAQWLSKRYIAPLAACVRLFTPPGGVPRMVRTRKGYWHLELPKIGEVDDRWVSLNKVAKDYVPRKNAIKQIQILNALSRGELRVAELSAEFGNVSSALKVLADKGVIRVERRRRMRGCVPKYQSYYDTQGMVASVNQPFTYSSKFELSQGQANALSTIQQAYSRANGSVVLLDGVTGSGKTEVYLQAISKVLSYGKTACVLVPEISLTPQTVARFRGRFGAIVAVIHSRMSDGERFDQWDFIRSGDARVVVGARSALFAPLSNIGLIIIDEEHETSYKQDSSPRYHVRDVAVWMAKRCGAAVVLGSATPSIESLYAAHKDPTWVQVVLPERANGRPLPQIKVVDMAREFSDGSRSMFSRCLSEALEEELSAGHKAVLLLNQRGFSKFLLCRDCGFVPTCVSCSTSLTFHERGNLLVCHHCGYRISAPSICPECGSPYLRKFGAGIQRVEDELHTLISSFTNLSSSIPIIRMDADTTRRKGSHQRLLEQFAAAPVAVLIGTQMIAKGLDFDDVTLVGVINADTQLNLPDYRAAERTFNLIEQVAGRAGRAKLEGSVLVQTYKVDSPAIYAAAAYDRASFLRDELPKRKALKYPPYVQLANILVWGEDEEKVRIATESLRKEIMCRVRDFGNSEWQVLAASPCVLEKLRNRYRWHIVVKAPLDASFSRVLLPYFRSRKATSSFNVAVDIDPVSLL